MNKFHLENTWYVEYGKPTTFGRLLNRGFMQWVTSDLQSEINSGLDSSTTYTAHTSVPLADRWLNAFVHDYMQFFNDGNSPSETKHFLVALEQSFNCQETNCVFHHEWFFHFEPFDPTDEDIQGCYDFGCLHHTVEAWIESFLEVRFPSISFDYDSLISANSLPQLHVHRYA